MQLMNDKNIELKTKLKSAIKKINYGDYPNPIELFCDEQYKGYYISGKLRVLNGNIYDLQSSKDIGYSYYLFLIFALINDNYKQWYEKRFPNDINSINKSAWFFWKNKKDYLEEGDKFFKQKLGFYENPLSSFQKIELKSLNINESDYLNERIKEKREIILLSMDIYSHKIKTDNKSLLKNFKRLFSILSLRDNTKSDFKDWRVTDWFDKLIAELEIYFDYKDLNTVEYHKILDDIGNLSCELIIEQKVTDDYLDKLNRFREKIGDRNHPLTNFCYKFFDDLIDKLINQKQIKICEYCGGFLKYKEGKKYCTLRSEGKDCGKSIRNQLYYERKKTVILPKARKNTAELRAFYKEKGIKK